MVEDTKESHDAPEAAEQAEPKSPLGQEGQQSMQGLAELRAEQEGELQEDVEKYQEEHEPWVQARREERLHDIVNAEPADDNEPPVE